MEKDEAKEKSVLMDLCKSYLTAFKYVTIDKNEHLTEIPEKDFFHDLNQILKKHLNTKEKNLKDAPQGSGPKFKRERDAIEKKIHEIKEITTKFHTFHKKIGIYDSMTFYKNSKITHGCDDTHFGSYSYVHSGFIIWDKTSLVGVQIEKFEENYLEEKTISEGS